jgi:hypothetical protein
VTSEQHLLIWNTSPMLGAVDGEVGPWFQLDVTPVGTTATPF